MRFSWLLCLVLSSCAGPVSPPADMVEVGAGECWLGSDDAEAFFHPPRRVFIARFWIDRCEVTHQQYQRFDPGHRVPPGQENCPVTHLTKEQALAYLRSQGKRLPSAAEWEKAARGSDGRRYPWGNRWEPERGNLTASGRSGGFCSTARMKPVGSFPSGASPYGCLDMCGNAWEWVSDLRQGRPVIRGGAYGYRESDCRCSSYATEDAGFT